MAAATPLPSSFALDSNSARTQASPPLILDIGYSDDEDDVSSARDEFALEPQARPSTCQRWSCTIAPRKNINTRSTSPILDQLETSNEDVKKRRCLEDRTLASQPMLATLTDREDQQCQTIARLTLWLLECAPGNDTSVSDAITFLFDDDCSILSVVTPSFILSTIDALAEMQTRLPSQLNLSPLDQQVAVQCNELPQPGDGNVDGTDGTDDCAERTKQRNHDMRLFALANTLLCVAYDGVHYAPIKVPLVPASWMNEDGADCRSMTGVLTLQASAEGMVAEVRNALRSAQTLLETSAKQLRAFDDDQARMCMQSSASRATSTLAFCRWLTSTRHSCSMHALIMRMAYESPIVAPGSVLGPIDASSVACAALFRTLRSLSSQQRDRLDAMYSQSTSTTWNIVRLRAAITDMICNYDLNKTQEDWLCKWQRDEDVVDVAQRAVALLFDKTLLTETHSRARDNAPLRRVMATKVVHSSQGLDRVSIVEIAQFICVVYDALPQSQDVVALTPANAIALALALVCDVLIAKAVQARDNGVSDNNDTRDLQGTLFEWTYSSLAEVSDAKMHSSSHRINIVSHSKSKRKRLYETMPKQINVGFVSPDALRRSIMQPVCTQHRYSCNRVMHEQMHLAYAFHALDQSCTVAPTTLEPLDVLYTRVSMNWIYYIGSARESTLALGAAPFNEPCDAAQWTVACRVLQRHPLLASFCPQVILSHVKNIPVLREDALMQLCRTVHWCFQNMWNRDSVMTSIGMEMTRPFWMHYFLGSVASKCRVR